MSMFLVALQDNVVALHSNAVALQDDVTVLAQVGNPTPEAPPLADKVMQFVRYLTWFVLLSGVTGIMFAGGKFAWEKWSGGALTAPKQIAGAMAGGVIATSAGTIMNAVLG